MNMLLLVAGWLLLVGGSLGVWSSLRDRRRGGPAWRGQLVASSALTAYGALALSGIMAGGTIFGALAVWAVVALYFTGSYLSFRDRRKARQAH